MIKKVIVFCFSLLLVLPSILTLPGPAVQAARLAATPAPAPVAVIRQPVNNTVIWGQVPIIGDALNSAFDYYKVEYAAEGQEQAEWMLIGFLHRIQVAADTLEVWDTTLVPEGSYQIRLRVIDKSGNYREYLVRGLTVIREQATATPTATLAAPTNEPPATRPALAESQPATPVLTPTPGLTQTAPLQLPAISSYDTTLAKLDYGEHILQGYGGSVDYFFTIPDNWLLLEGSYLNLHVSYTSAAPKEMETGVLWMNARLIVDIDDKTQVSTPLSPGTTEESYLNVVLPPGLFADPKKPNHSIKVTLDVDGECYWVMSFRLKIHPDSFMHFEYKRSPVPADLALYPRPFVQNSLEPDAVRFVLPHQPTSHDLANALAISAKLGQLSHGQAAISSTTDIQLLEQPAHTEPLIVVGKPQDNRLIARLASLVDAPVALGKREMLLSSRGPNSATPGQPFNYTITVTNTTDRTATGLAVTDILPRGSQFLACAPRCSQEGRNVFWTLDPLAPQEATTATLTLQAMSTVTNTIIENSVILTGSNRAVLNANTFATAVGSSGDLKPENGVSLSSGEGFFFITPDGREVAENDGIIQEFHSPWNTRQAILVVTGLTDEALYKASQVLSTQTYFPGMQGSFALIQGILPPIGDKEEVLKEQVTFADLGLDDEIVSTLLDTSYIYYSFRLPAAWTIGAETYLQLHFSHSQLIDFRTSWLGVSFNGKPLITVPLNESNASRGILEVYLPPTEAWSGINEVVVSVSLTWGEECVDPRAGGAWLVIYKDSFLHFSYQKQQLDLTLNLDQFPYPFAGSSDLKNLAFVLPGEPTIVEREGATRLAAQIGYGSGGDHFAPLVVFGDDVSQEIKENYHLIAIGRPTANSLIRAVNSQLPQPFREGFDEIEQQIDRIVFRLPAGISLGLIEEIPSPWNENRAILAVTGTTDEGVAQALSALTNPNVAMRLAGNLTIIREDQIHNIETRELTSSGKTMAALTAVPELAPTSPVTATTTTTVTQTPFTAQLTPTITFTAPAEWKRPAWLTPLAAVSVLTALLIFVLGARRTAKLK